MMLKRIGEAIKRNKEDIKTIVIGVFAIFLTLITIFNVMLVVITQDLTQRVKDQEYAMQEMYVDLHGQGEMINYILEEEELCFSQGYLETDEYKITCEYKYEE